MKTGAITISAIAASLPHATVWYCGFTAACVMPSVSVAEALDRLKIKGKKNSCQLVTRLIKNNVAIDGRNTGTITCQSVDRKFAPPRHHNKGKDYQR